jgi:lambda family phage minor tail protein L
MAIPFSELNKINPSSIIELFELELTLGKHIPADNPLSLPTIYRFHAGTSLNFFGELKYRSESYQRVVVKAEGFERKSTGVISRPTLTFSNLGGIVKDPNTDVVITMSDFLQQVNQVTPNNDLIDAKVTRKMPLASALDNNNFTTNVNPFGTPSNDRLRDEIFVIDRKAMENRKIVAFELTAAHDLENRLVPQRVVTRDLFPAVGTFV